MPNFAVDYASKTPSPAASASDPPAREGDECSVPRRLILSIFRQPTRWEGTWILSHNRTRLFNVGSNPKIGSAKLAVLTPARVFGSSTAASADAADPVMMLCHSTRFSPYCPRSKTPVPSPDHSSVSGRPRFYTPAAGRARPADLRRQCTR